MKKIIIGLLATVLIQASMVTVVMGNPNDAKDTAKVRTNVLKLGTGPEAKVKVTLKDKTKLEGYVAKSNDAEFVVMKSKSNEPVTVPYSQVRQVKGNNLNTGVVIGIAIAAAIVFVILAARSLK